MNPPRKSKVWSRKANSKHVQQSHITQVGRKSVARESQALQNNPLAYEHGVDTPSSLPIESGQQIAKEKLGRRNEIKFPNGSGVSVWQKLDRDLSNILKHLLCSRVETKLHALGDILYEECRDWFSEISHKCSIAPRGK